MGPDRSPQLSPTTRNALRVLAVAQWLTWLWMVGIVIFDGPALRHVTAAWIGVAATLAVTVWATWAAQYHPASLIRPPFVIAEVALALGLSILDGYVFQPGHVFATTQSLATQWPLLAMAVVGFAAGPWVAAACGALMGPAEWLGALANGVRSFDLRQIVSLVASSLFFVACGAVFGGLARALQRAEADVADRQARDELARVMHDTVLQTLALVTRRTSDPDLAAAARDADRDVRAFLFGSSSRKGDDLETLVRREVERSASASAPGSPTNVSVSVIGKADAVDHHGQRLIARAIGEAVANAHQHAGASRIVVFVEADERGRVFASVNDDGTGFDIATDRTSHGIDESILARMASIGGHATVRSTQGDRDAGTEVLLWSHAEDATPDRH